MAKVNPRRQIKDGSKQLQMVMQTYLSVMAEDLVNRIVKRIDSATESQKVNAIKDIDVRGLNEYKANLLEVVAALSEDAINGARKEVPKAKKVKLADMNDLPGPLKKKLKTQIDLTVFAQTDQLKKSITFGFIHNYDTTDSTDVLRKDLSDAADEFLSGSSIRNSAEVVSSTTVNASREEFFNNEEVSENIEAYQFVNGDPVTEICQEMNGHIFAKDDPELFRYTPPLHWNCKSWIKPIIVGNLGNREPGKAAPSKSALESMKFDEMFQIAINRAVSGTQV